MLLTRTLSVGLINFLEWLRELQGNGLTRLPVYYEMTELRNCPMEERPRAGSGKKDGELPYPVWGHRSLNLPQVTIPEVLGTLSIT